MSKREFGELVPNPDNFLRFESDSKLLDMQCNMVWLYARFSQWLLQKNTDLNTATQEEIENLLNMLVSLRALHGLVASRIKTGLISGPAVEEVEFAIETQSREFSNRCGFKKPQSRPLPDIVDPKLLSMRVHDLGNATLGIKMALETKDKARAQESFTNTTKKFYSQARKAYTIIGKEPLPTEPFPVTIYDFQLELESLADIYVHSTEIEGHYVFEFADRDFLSQFDESVFLMDPSDISGFLANIFQNEDRAYDRRDVVHMVDPIKYKDRSKEPRIIRVKYDVTDPENVKVIIEDQAIGFRQDFIEFGYRVGETTTEDEEEHGLGMADYRERFEKLGIKIVLENYNYDLSDPNAIGARQTYIFPRPASI